MTLDVSPDEFVCDTCRLVHWRATGSAACDRQDSPPAVLRR